MTVKQKHTFGLCLQGVRNRTSHTQDGGSRWDVDQAPGPSPTYRLVAPAVKCFHTCFLTLPSQDPCASWQGRGYDPYFQMQNLGSSFWDRTSVVKMRKVLRGLYGVPSETLGDVHYAGDG